VASEYQDLGVEGFLEEVSLMSDIETTSRQGDAVTLTTLHGAKGLEFDVVFMSGMEESVFPHSRAFYDQTEMEEERRLCYVGMTRARKELYLLFAASRLLYGGMQHNPPSRFLSDIDEDLLQASAGTYDSPPTFSPSAGAFSQETRYVPDLEEGDGVKHKLFGMGTVMHLDGDIATIKFAKSGIKQLDIGLAPLEKLE
jgi:DNA helicase-2/ATP-dependent DNA helicase PcrA